jgi:hypothetical protein
MVKRVDPISSSAQISLGLEGEPEQLQRKRPVDPGYREIHEKYNPPEKDPKGKAAENKEFEDKRQPKSDLIRQAEIAKMKEILDKPKAQPTEQPKLKFGNPVAEAYFKSHGGGGGGGGGSMTDPMERKTKPYNKAKAGIIKSASKRADGCAIRGKTRA